MNHRPWRFERAVAMLAPSATVVLALGCSGLLDFDAVSFENGGSAGAFDVAYSG